MQPKEMKLTGFLAPHKCKHLRELRFFLFG